MRLTILEPPTSLPAWSTNTTRPCRDLLHFFWRPRPFYSALGFGEFSLQTQKLREALDVFLIHVNWKLDLDVNIGSQ